MSSSWRSWLLLAAVALATAIAFAATASASATAPSAVFAPCGPEVFPGFECGTVLVPVDRASPSSETIPIAFQLFRHSDTSVPSSGTIVTSVGGPGNSNTVFSAFWLFRFLPLLDQRDLLVIDHRGMGQSGAIDCPALQHFTGDLAGSTRACGAQLGASADRYGSGDVADDVDDVREALGIDTIDYYGDSYGAVDVRAYAYRYPSHLRSAVLDSPWVSEDWTFQTAEARFTAEVQATVCRRSPSCIDTNPDPEATLQWLAEELRKHPFDGIGYDAEGGAHTLHVDESTLFDVLMNEHYVDPAFLNQGELTAAAEALRHGDRVPLLRLAAESPPVPDSGDPAGLVSTGAAVAVFCADGRFAWNKNAPEAVREAQFRTALAALPGDSFAPFSASAWLDANARVPGGLFGSFTSEKCVHWPSPDRPDPPYPANQPFPASVPALILSGGLDVLPPDEVRAALPLFAAGTPFVEVANSGHVTLWWNDCAQGIILNFIDTLQTGGTSCATDSSTPMRQPFGAAPGLVQLQGVSQFPRTAQQASAAQPDPSAPDATTPADRRVANVVWWTVQDAVYRSLRMTGTQGRGLRGGQYAVTRSDFAIEVDLNGVHFTDDVSVTGHVTLDRATSTVEATVDVDGPGAFDGNIVLSAILWDPGHPKAAIHGTLRDRPVSLMSFTH